MGDVIQLKGWLTRKLERERDEMPLAEMIKKHDKWNDLWTQTARVLADERKKNNE